MVAGAKAALAYTNYNSNNNNNNQTLIIIIIGMIRFGVAVIGCCFLGLVHPCSCYCWTGGQVTTTFTCGGGRVVGACRGCGAGAVSETVVVW